MTTIQKTAEAWSKLGANYAASNVHKFGPSLPKLLALARPNTDDVCLDVGTGAGHTAANLAAIAKKVYGLDPAEGMLNVARESYGHLTNLEFVSGTSEVTGFPDNIFDIVTARHTLHHHPHMDKTLLELKRVLKPGGRLVIADEITLTESINDWFHELELAHDPTHVRAYYAYEWQAFIREAGLLWVVGDTATRYSIEVEQWIANTKLNPEFAERVRQLFREASLKAKELLNIDYKDNDPKIFDLPVIVALAVKSV
ncbi:MAG: class I SAM-dependent methyltransferase [Trueperaceae bacterium]